MPSFSDKKSKPESSLLRKSLSVISKWRPLARYFAACLLIIVILFAPGMQHGANTTLENEYNNVSEPTAALSGGDSSRSENSPSVYSPNLTADDAAAADNIIDISHPPPALNSFDSLIESAGRSNETAPDAQAIEPASLADDDDSNASNAEDAVSSDTASASASGNNTPAPVAGSQSGNNSAPAQRPQLTAVYSADGEPLPYLVYVSKNSFTVAILELDENMEYTSLFLTYRTAIGRTSAQTRAGTFTITEKTRWIPWTDSTYTPYGTKHSGGLWFHGPVYEAMDSYSMVAESYEAIGTNATAGCMRTTTSAARWIYYNIPIGTRVIIANDSKYTSSSPPGIAEEQNFDPTDPRVRADDLPQDSSILDDADELESHMNGDADETQDIQ